MDPFLHSPGNAPLLVSIPHCGTAIPAELAARMTPAALALPDTDWHLPRLYDFVHGLDVTMLAATHSRYVIDLNRPPDGSSLYPGANNTELCPLTTFALEPIYRAGEEPGEDEIRARIATYHAPYHARLAAELDRLRARHGYAVLFDAHSIISVCPRFFDGRLPDLNLGTGGGTSCAPPLADALFARAKASPYSAVLNGRFKGGHITRHFGRPQDGVHAVQLEMACCVYMTEAAPYPYDEALAGRLRPVLQSLVRTMLDWRP